MNPIPNADPNLQVALREEGAQPAGGDARRVLVERVRVRLRRERVHERHVDGGACGGRGHRRRDQRLGDGEAVAEAERGAAELVSARVRGRVGFGLGLGFGFGWLRVWVRV